MGPEQPPLPPDEQAYLDRRRAEIAEAARANNAQMLRNLLFSEALGASNSEVRHEAKRRQREEETNPASNATAQPFEGRVGDDTTMKHKAKVGQTVVQEMVRVYKENRNLIPAARDQVSGQVVSAIVDKFVAPNTEINEYGAAYLYKIFDKARRGRIENPLDLDGDTLSAQEFRELHALDRTTYNKVVDSLVEVARARGGDDLETRISEFRDEITPRDRRRRDGQHAERDPFETYEWPRLRNFFDEDDLPLTRALYHPGEFETYVVGLRQSIAGGSDGQEALEDTPENKSAIDRRTGEALERNIVLLFSKIMSRVDTERPTEFFDQIADRGFQESINSTFTSLTGALRRTVRDVEKRQKTEGSIFRDIRFVNRYTKQTIEARQVKVPGDDAHGHGGHGHEEEERFVFKPVDRMTPTSATKTVSASEFIESIEGQVDREFDTRKYLHNVRAMFFQPAGEHGFWGQLAGYARQMPATDIDAMMLLPDSDIFMAAARLYSKHVEEEFAMYNWIHRAPMFSFDLQKRTTAIEDRVEEDLKKLFRSRDGKDLDGWRLRRAMSIGIGLSKGVLMTEVEAAAWADPEIEQDGTTSYKSYYTNDSAALAPLNPMHHFFRWQSEDVMTGPILFLPILNQEHGLFHMWDHHELWHKLKEYKASYLKGTGAFHRPHEKLFADVLPNWARVGSVISRGSWRIGPAYEGWLFYDREPNGALSTRLQYLKSWKAIENIGFEVASNFMNAKVSDAFLGTASEARNELVQYVYKKYINKNATGSWHEIEEEIRRIKAELGDDDKVAYRRLMNLALVGMINDRMPTKFIRTERDRTTPNGVRRWDQMRTRLGMSFEQMNNAMKNITLAETKVRQQTTEAMRDHLRNTASPDNPDLSGFETNEYVVTEAVLKQVIDGEGQPDSESYQDTLRVFRDLRTQYLENPAFLNEFAMKIDTKNRNDYFPFAIGSEEVELSFLSYRNAGPTILARALGDIGGVETSVFNPLKEFLGALHSVSLDSKHDISKLLGPMTKIRDHIRGMHGPDAAAKAVYQLSAMAISYFKKDSIARNFITQWFQFGHNHSLASEFVGSNREVWEWDVQDIDNFIVALERQHLLPKDNYVLNAEPDSIHLGFNLFGKNINLGHVRTASKGEKYNYTAAKLRQDFGASPGNIGLEMFNKYVPAIVIFLLIKYIQEALKEFTGDKGGGGH